MQHWLGIALLSGLTDCGAGPGVNYVGGSVVLECAPFARVLSGVALTGPADGWWDGAAGRFRRSSRPEPGSVLVFRRSGRLGSGHVAVVSEVLARREILVIQANWVHHRVTLDQAVIDVSPANDWSMVRVFWPPSNAMGAGEYPAYGFIHASHPASHDQLAAAAPRAVSAALER